MEQQFVDQVWNSHPRMSNPYDELVSLRKKSYEMYKQRKLAEVQTALQQLGPIDSIIKTKQVINIVDSFKQTSKSRGGINFELFIAKIFDYYGVVYHRQKLKHLKGDFIFERCGKYIILSVKTTYRERWKQLADDIQDGVSEVYTMTLETIVPTTIESIHKLGIKIIEHDISLKEFIWYLKGMSADKLNTIDLFCGAGGLSQGFETAGFTTLLGMDSNITAVDTYQLNYPHAKTICDNIKAVSANQVDDIIDHQCVNLIIGGPPCTSVSMAGRRDPSDTRQTLFFDFIRMIKYFMPQVVVMENVPGLLSAKNPTGGRVFDDILSNYQEIGYKVYYQKLNAYHYGVPQKRQRVFFVCIRDDIKKEYTFPPPIAADQRLVVRNILEDTVDQKYYLSQKMVDGFIKRKNDNQANGKGYGYQLLDLDQPSYTISSRYYKDGSDALLDTPNGWRKLTEVEVARIQSFPADYKFAGTAAEIYTQIGNAVPCLLAQHIAQSVKDFLADVPLISRKTGGTDEIEFTLTYNDLLSYNKTELINLCKRNNIKGYSKYRKNELIEFLRTELIDT